MFVLCVLVMFSMFVLLMYCVIYLCLAGYVLCYFYMFVLFMYCVVCVCLCVDLLPEAEAHGIGQDACASTRPPGGADQTADRGQIPGRRTAAGRDGEGLSGRVRSIHAVVRETDDLLGHVQDGRV